MDEIFVKGMSFYGYHGVLPEENSLGQRFLLDVTLGCDTREAGETDDLQASISYAEVYDICRQKTCDERFQLVERLGHVIALEILDTYEKCQWVKVRVAKPNPPIDGNYEQVGVEIYRSRA